MSDVAEGLGAAIEGAAAARTVEPYAGGVSDANGHAGICCNCGSAVSGAYCAHCGQKWHVHRSLTAIDHDLIHGVLHLDGKLWAALPLLTLKPGELTRRYIRGERAKFVSPMAMFLFSVFAMFAVFQMVGLTTPTSLDLRTPERAFIAQGLAQSEHLSREIEKLPAGDPARLKLEQDLALLEDLLKRGDDSGAEGQSIADAEDTMAFDLRDTEWGTNLTGLDGLGKGIIKKWQENPGLMLYKLQANGYKFSWLLIPLSLPFVWLLFVWKRRILAYDYTVFITYSLSFMSLLFIALSLMNAAGLSVGWVLALFSIIAPLHIYKHLRYSYGLSRFSTIWRFLALQLFISVVLVLFLQALLLLGAF